MISIEIIVQAELDKIKAQLPERTARVSSALRNSVFNVMTGGGVSAPIRYRFARRAATAPVRRIALTSGFSPQR